MKVYVIINDDKVRAIYADDEVEVEIVNYDDTIDSEEYEQCYYRERALEETKKVVY